MICGKVILFVGIFAFLGSAVEHDYIQQLQYAFDNRLEDLCSKSTDAKLCKDAGQRCLSGLKTGDGVTDDRKTKFKGYFNTCITNLQLESKWQTYKVANPDASKNLAFFSSLDQPDSVNLKCCIGRETGKLDANNKLDKPSLIQIVDKRVGTTDDVVLNGLKTGINSCNLGDECDVRGFLRCALQSCVSNILKV